jgi:hypothetical protein
VVLVVAIWGNLHGAVLMGVAVVGAYLLCSRLRHRPRETVAVGVGTVLAVGVNPTLLGTVHYYAGVLGNEAARRGSELWARPNPGNLFDLLLIVAGAALVVLALWSRPPLWENVAILGLLAGTVTSARHGVWLLMLCAAPAAVRLTRRSGSAADAPGAAVPVAAALVVLVGCTGLLWSRLDGLNPSGNPELVSAVKALAQQRVVLADEPVAESLAAEGVRIWMSNPIDAFDRADQAAYLDFVSGSPSREVQALLDTVEVVVVRSGGAAEALVSRDGHFAPVPRVGQGWRVFERIPSRA